jgi:signal transduction histidine kinase
MAITIGQGRVWLDRALDPVIAALVFALSLPPLLNLYDCACTPAPAWGIGVLAAQCLPLVGRRRWPLASTLACGTATVAYTVSGLPEPPVVYAGLVAVYSVAAHASRRRALFAAAVTVVAIAVALLFDTSPVDLDEALVTYLLFCTAWLLGNGVRDRRERTGELEERAAALERTRAAEAERAVVQERNRIARELHDVVAHHVSMMVVQAEAGPVALQRDPARAVESFETISATGKQALGEMRRLLGVLRTDPADRLTPQPGVGDVPALVDRVRATGLDVQLRIAGQVRKLTPAVDLSAFRLLQEALTNVVRHAGADRASVLLEYQPDALHLEVLDDGAGADGSGASGDGSANGSAAGGGHGLLAMRERVRLLSGSVVVGPRSTGGWAVRARLPLDESARMPP